MSALQAANLVLAGPHHGRVAPAVHGGLVPRILDGHGADSIVVEGGHRARGGSSSGGRPEGDVALSIPYLRLAIEINDMPEDNVAAAAARVKRILQETLGSELDFDDDITVEIMQHAGGKCQECDDGIHEE